VEGLFWFQNQFQIEQFYIIREQTGSSILRSLQIKWFSWKPVIFLSKSIEPVFGAFINGDFMGHFQQESGEWVRHFISLEFTRVIHSNFTHFWKKSLFFTHSTLSLHSLLKILGSLDTFWFSLKWNSSFVHRHNSAAKALIWLFFNNSWILEQLWIEKLVCLVMSFNVQATQNVFDLWKIEKKYIFHWVSLECSLELHSTSKKNPIFSLTRHSNFTWIRFLTIHSSLSLHSN
jgi:hypothetical protein